MAGQDRRGQAARTKKAQIMNKRQELAQLGGPAGFGGGAVQGSEAGARPRARSSDLFLGTLVFHYDYKM